MVANFHDGSNEAQVDESECFVAPQFLSSISFVILGAIFCFIESRFDIMLALGSSVASRSVALSGFNFIPCHF